MKKRVVIGVLLVAVMALAIWFSGPIESSATAGAGHAYGYGYPVYK